MDKYDNDISSTWYLRKPVISEFLVIFLLFDVILYLGQQRVQCQVRLAGNSRGKGGNYQAKYLF